MTKWLTLLVGRTERWWFKCQEWNGVNSFFIVFTMHFSRFTKFKILSVES